MRILLLVTSSEGTFEWLIKSFVLMQHDLRVTRWDIPNFNVTDTINRVAPDVAIFVGAHSSHPYPVPADALATANREAPIILFSPDSMDDPMHPQLEEYYALKSFRLMIGADGCKDSLLAKYGLVCITPHLPEDYPAIPYKDKPFRVGFAGGVGWRMDMLNALRAKGLLTHLPGYPNRPYPDVCNFYASCKFVTNLAVTGSRLRLHVKGRVMEAALAGAVLLEQAGSPTRDWFEPGVDYFEWRDTNELCDLAMQDGPEIEAMAERFHRKAIEKYSARPFWNGIFAKLGLDFEQCKST